MGGNADVTHAGAGRQHGAQTQAHPSLEGAIVLDLVHCGVTVAELNKYGRPEEKIGRLDARRPR